MKPIREPKNIDFSGKSKPWTEKELVDFRKLMIELKAKKLPAGKTGVKRKLVSAIRRKKTIA